MKIIKSLLKSFWQAFHTDDEIVKIKKHYPRLTGFISRRLNTKHFAGLPLTLLLIAFFYVLLLFGGVTEDLIKSDIIISADERISTLFYIFRNPTAVTFFLWLTLLGKSYIIILLTFVTTIILWLNQKKWYIATLWLALFGSETFTYVTKLILNRPRPQLAVYLEHSASFPSGHATIAMAFYGFLIYLSWKLAKKRRQRILITLFNIILIILIGFSRLYLGVHYASDVWAGYLVGLLWLIISISIFEWKMSTTNNSNSKIILKPKTKQIITLGLLIIAFSSYITYGYFYHPQTNNIPHSEIFLTAPEIKTIFSDYNLPRYTETLTGKSQEPISFIITSRDDDTIKNAFSQAGWLLGDQINPASLKKLGKTAIFNQAYTAAPMTPSFWNKEVHTFGWEKSTGADTVRQRHHTRFWKTNFITTAGDHIYLGTASLDTGIKWFITHQISPDIDTERELILTDLTNTGLIKNVEKIKLVDPILGQNFSGDQFFTDGQAYIINL